jgi:hypothetical protein
MSSMTSGAGSLARELLKRMGDGAEPNEVAALFGEHLEWEIAGDEGALRGSANDQLLSNAGEQLCRLEGRPDLIFPAVSVSPL